MLQTIWKDRVLVNLDGLEPYLFEILENGVFVPKSPTSTLENVLTKPQKQWSLEDIKLVNGDKRLKNIIILCLSNDIMKSVIKCTNAKSMWNDLILGHEGSFETRDTKIAALRLKFNVFKALEGEKVQQTYTRLKILLNDLETKDIIIPQAEAESSGRPQAAIEKMVQGRLRKYFEEVVLIERNVIVNDTINTLLSELSNEVGFPVTIFKNASFVG
ncbi:retrovirus-related pol polyprotein from transposon TNT 1-94 [Tanacetum coccineum]